MGALGLAALLANTPMPAAGPAVEFVDVTASAGLRWDGGPLAPRGFNLVETMGGGGGLVDVDNDGLLDVYLVAYSLSGHDVLYRNNGDGTFADVTARAGLRPGMRGMGLAAADYDGDGWTDLYVSGYRASRLYHNEGGGRFREVSGRAGVANARWGTSAAFFDYDGDADLDLFVCHYLDFDPAGPIPCQMIDERPFCSIDKFRGSPSALFRNDGDGTFTDVSVAAGVANPAGKGLGVVAADFDDDGRADLFQANDTAPNFLYRNRGDGTFEDVGLRAEVAYDATGRALGAMGVDAEDVDGDGRLDVFVTNFTNQANSLFRNQGGAVFREAAAGLGLAAPSVSLSGFGARFLDYDNDGAVDLLVANGHPFEPVARVWPGITWAEPLQLFRRTAEGFREVAADHGAALRRHLPARGLATGDVDNDGDTDALVMCAGAPPRLLRNDGGSRQGWLGVRLVGRPPNRDAVGARVAVTASGRRREKHVLGGTSYCSASDPRLLFGLGAAARVERLEVRWPDGVRLALDDVGMNQYLTVRQDGAMRPR
jgi:enediyne biosynthesis protein E4